MLITVEIDGKKKQYEMGTPFEQIADEYQDRYDGLIGLVAVNGKIKELFKHLKKDCQIRFFTLKDDIGNKSYIRTATMLIWIRKSTNPLAKKHLASISQMHLDNAKQRKSHAAPSPIWNFLSRIWQQTAFLSPFVR